MSSNNRFNRNTVNHRDDRNDRRRVSTREMFGSDLVDSSKQPPKQPSVPEQPPEDKHRNDRFGFARRDERRPHDRLRDRPRKQRHDEHHSHAPKLPEQPPVPEQLPEYPCADRFSFARRDERRPREHHSEQPRDERHEQPRDYPRSQPRDERREQPKRTKPKTVSVIKPMPRPELEEEVEFHHK